MAQEGDKVAQAVQQALTEPYPATVEIIDAYDPPLTEQELADHAEHVHWAPPVRGGVMTKPGSSEWVRWPDLDAEQKRARLGTVIHVVTMLACLAIAVSLIMLAVWASHHYGWIGPDGSPTR